MAKGNKSINQIETRYEKMQEKRVAKRKALKKRERIEQIIALFIAIFIVTATILLMHKFNDKSMNNYSSNCYVKGL